MVIDANPIPLRQCGSSRRLPLVPERVGPHEQSRNRQTAKHGNEQSDHLGRQHRFHLNRGHIGGLVQCVLLAGRCPRMRLAFDRAEMGVLAILNVYRL
jgi:hypothetical protein